MNNIEFVSKIENVASDYKTVYVMGCFGAPLTGSNVDRYCNNHSYNRQTARTTKIKSKANQSPPVFGFDCVCLIKAVLWGWNGDASRTYGGAIYTSNDVPDIGADQMIRVCRDVSSDFSTIIPGEAVWMEGHIGVYVGGGLAVECTPIWADGVQYTACNRDVSGYNRRNWTKHGKLPYIDYMDETGFVDVPDDAWYAAAVKWAAEQGIASGVDATHFAPNQICTRAQIVTMLWASQGKPEPKTTENPFTDVKETDYYYKAVLWAVENGITNGVSANKFGPGMSCTRAQAVTFLYGLAGKPEGKDGKTPFADVAETSYYHDAVAWAVENGITAGTSATTFGSNDTCTRAQMVMFLHRMSKL